MPDLLEVEVVLDVRRTKQMRHLREPFLAAFDALPRLVETEDVKVGAESDELWIPAERSTASALGTPRACAIRSTSVSGNGLRPVHISNSTTPRL
jgi:hypothetical protein